MLVRADMPFMFMLALLALLYLLALDLRSSCFKLAALMAASEDSQLLIMVLSRSRRNE